MQRALLVCALCALLAGCGFELRGSAHIPFKTVYVGVQNTSPIAVELKRSIRGSGSTVLVNDVSKAEARIDILSEALTSDILTINSVGQASEYTLHYHMRFKVSNTKGYDYIPATELTLTRLVLANNNATLAENYEITQLFYDMEVDAAQQILRRVEALHPVP